MNSEKIFENQLFPKEYIEKILTSLKITEEITKDNDYIDWLEKYIAKHGSFSNGWLCSSEQISKKDIEQVSKLSNFYDAIEKYANRNFVYAEKTKSGEQFYIKYNNNGYIIGIEPAVGYGTVFYAESEKITKKNSEKFIDFKLIQENKPMDKTEEISNKLNDLNNAINDIVKEDVPIEAISETINNNLKVLKKKYK